MDQEQLEYITVIKESFYSEEYLSELCRFELVRPKFKNLLFAFTLPKKMYVYNMNTDERFEY